MSDQKFRLLFEVGLYYGHASTMEGCPSKTDGRENLPRGQVDWRPLEAREAEFLSGGRQIHWQPGELESKSPIENRFDDF